MTRRLTGLQKEVFKLYREILRTAQAQTDKAYATTLKQHARSQFDDNREIKKTDIQLIEHLLRKGRRQLELLSDPHTTGIQLHQPSR